eukprot:gene13354-4204_t
MSREQLLGRAEFTDFVRLIEAIATPTGGSHYTKRYVDGVGHVLSQPIMAYAQGIQKCNGLKQGNLTGFIQNCEKYELLIEDIIKSFENVSSFEGGGKLETLLLSIYNKEAAGNRETPFAKSYRIPSLSNSSIYHEPLSATSSALTERALSRHEQSDKPVLMKASTKILNRISASSRSDVLNTILSVYNSNISAMTESSHIGFCKMVVRIARSGFAHLESDDPRLTSLLDKQELDSIKHYTRIKLSNDVYQQMLTGLYFIMYDGFGEAAYAALKSLEVMARHTLNAALTMTVRAMTSHIESSFKETQVPLACNPMKSIRRQIDSTKRRYAFTGSPALLTPDSALEKSQYKDESSDAVDAATTVSHTTNSAVKEPASSAIENNPNVAEGSVALVNEKRSSSLSDNERPTNLHSESEDDANESTNLLKEHAKPTEKKDTVNHERIKINIVTDDDDNFKNLLNMADVELTYQPASTEPESEVRFDTSL